MDVNTRFHLCIHVTRFGTCDETPTLLHNGMHHFDKVEYHLIWKRLWALVVEIDEKPENIRLLLHNVQFLTESYRMYTFYVKFVKLFKRNLKNPTIHKDVCPRALVCEPFLHKVQTCVFFILPRYLLDFWANLL